MPAKIEFQVISRTGEDDGFRATELNHHGPTVRGWRSPPNCDYPQEIILRLNVSAILHQIQILAHHYLIPRKIEIWTSVRPDPTLEPPSNWFQYLGFVTFSDNSTTGFRSRELKSILIPEKEAKYVKFRIHGNHDNVKNIWNQVGLVAVNVLGEALCIEVDERDDNCYLPPIRSRDPRHTSPYDDLAFEMYVDEETAKIMKMLEREKMRAVSEERFDYADELKIILKKLRAAGEILGLYEQEKNRAVYSEDYDKAKIKKNQIDMLRKKIYNDLHVARVLETNEVLGDYEVICTDENNCLSTSFISNQDGFIKNPKSKSSNDFINNNMIRSTLDNDFQFKSLPPPRGNKSDSFWTNQIKNYESLPPDRDVGLFSKDIPSEEYPDGKLEDKADTDDTSSSADSRSFSSDGLSLPKSVERFPISPPMSDARSAKDSATLRKTFTNGCDSSPWKTSNPDEKSKLRMSASDHAVVGTSRAARPPINSFDAYEDRMLPALKSYRRSEIVRECQLAFEQPRKSTLNDREKKQAALPISIFGTEMVEKFYSKNFNEKEDGLKRLQEELKNLVKSTDAQENTTKAPFNKIARAAIFLLHRALRDKVFSVYSCAAETVRMFFAEYVPKRVSPPEVARSVEKLLPELLNKSGDVTPRIHNMAAHTILSMADCEEVRRLNVIPIHLSRPLTSSVHPRLALSRLEMVEQLILSHGMSKDKKSGLTSRTLAEFGSSGLHHPAEAVRKVSERILIQVYKVNPAIVRKQLPPDDNVTRRNLQYRQLFKEFDIVDLQRKTKEPFIDDPNLGFETDAKEGMEVSLPENLLLSEGVAKLEKKNIKSEIENSTTVGTTLKFPSLVDSTVVAKIRASTNSNKNSSVGVKLTDSNANERCLLENGGEKPKTNEVKRETGIPIRHLEGSKQKQGIPIKTTTFKLERKTKNKSQSSERPVDVALSKKRMLKSLQNLQEPRLTTNGNGPDETKPKEVVPSDLVKGNENLPNHNRRHRSTRLCIFCQTPIKCTHEDSLNDHYAKHCLMLTTCDYCNEVMEISDFSNHLSVDCKRKNLFRKCGSCQEVVLKDSKNHECTGSINIQARNAAKCPFCHTRIGNEDGCWRKHLMGKNNCSKHPRKKTTDILIK